MGQVKKVGFNVLVRSQEELDKIDMVQSVVDNMLQWVRSQGVSVLMHTPVTQQSAGFSTRDGGQNIQVYFVAELVTDGKGELRLKPRHQVEGS